ncbi:MAG: adenylate kinase [Dehalococcoidia bacterium]|nr:adenylate kinase [Dehalococcoidia bacterium]
MAGIGRRVIVIGNTSAGKSTLAERLAGRLGVPFVELDALFWKPGWVEAEDEEFRTRVRDATAGDAWVIAGNYNTRTQDITWPRAETIIYLDYPLPLVLWRVLNRSWRRWRSRELLWGTNRESFWKHLTSWDDSLLVFAVQAQRKHRQRWPELVSDPRWSQTRFLRFCSPAETQRWFESLRPEASDLSEAPGRTAAAE